MNRLRWKPDDVPTNRSHEQQQISAVTKLIPLAWDNLNLWRDIREMPIKPMSYVKQFIHSFWRLRTTIQQFKATFNFPIWCATELISSVSIRFIACGTISTSLGCFPSDYITLSKRSIFPFIAWIINNNKNKTIVISTTCFRFTFTWYCNFVWKSQFLFIIYFVDVNRK